MKRDRVGEGAGVSTQVDVEVLTEAAKLTLTCPAYSAVHRRATSAGRSPTKLDPYGQYIEERVMVAPDWIQRWYPT
jgi:hypothetical protein